MKTLVILTDNFGLNFSGGAIATCRTFEAVQDEFKEVIAIAQQVGQHNFRRFYWKPYRRINHALEHIQDLKKSQEAYIFYGDFYMTYYYRLLGVPYFFGYHDSWPEQWQLGWRFKIRGLFFIPVYRWVISGAKGVVTVSEHKGQFVKQLNVNYAVIRNGINTASHKQALRGFQQGVFKIIMLGNVTDLKFGQAVRLFELIKVKGFPVDLQVDIYGKEINRNLAKKLANFAFVQLKGFSDNISFSEYHLLLKTSKMENLSIAVVEALMNHTPVVCFDVGGLSEVVEHGKNGLLVPAGDVEAMYAALIRAVEGLELFDFSKQNLVEYSWEKAGQHYLNFFNQWDQ